MPSPFPGMDPYLEDHIWWPDVHLSLIAAMRDVLVPQVAPRYVVRTELLTYTIQVGHVETKRRPDVAIVPRPGGASTGGGTATATLAPPVTAAYTVLLPLLEEVSERYLEIRDTRTHEVITAIELLSPTNKASGAGRNAYERKRAEVLASMTNLVEIDLLRGGEPMYLEQAPESLYRILVSPAWQRREAGLYAFGLQQALPEIAVPLRQEEAPARLAFGPLLNDVYDRARYDLSVDYTGDPPEPPLSPEDATWVDALLRTAGQRS